MYVGGIRGGLNNPAMFGPTIRVSPDTNISLRLTNELIGQPKEKASPHLMTRSNNPIQRPALLCHTTFVPCLPWHKDCIYVEARSQ